MEKNKNLKNIKKIIRMKISELKKKINYKNIIIIIIIIINKIEIRLWIIKKKIKGSSHTHFSMIHRND